MKSVGVTVVVPAYNAAGTIADTLRTISAQTFGDFEILVVDDGSNDGTDAVVEDYARAEPRLSLIRQANGGVGAARNTGIRNASASFVAPIDADDLWHPRKLEMHVAALRQNPSCAFVYSPFRILNVEGRLIGNHPFFAFSGNVFHRQLFYNMVGNGSGMTFRREAAIEAGCYDESLRAAGLQGCEDWLLQMLMSLERPVAHVPAYLIGYRKAPGAMSADTKRMWRSRIMAAGIIRRHAPAAAAPFIDAAEVSFSARLAFQTLRVNDYRPLLGAIQAGVEKGLVGQLVGEVGETMVRARRAKIRRGPPGGRFQDIDPALRPQDDLSLFTRRLIKRLEQADGATPLREAMRAIGAPLAAGLRATTARR